MEEILHQLVGSLSNYLQDLYIPGGAGFPVNSTCGEKALWMVLGIV